MRALHRGVGAACAVLARGAILLAGVAMVAMVAIVAWGVFGRFVLNDTPAWAEASALLLLAWVILGAAAAGVREGFHMGFDTLRDVLPAPLGRLFKVLSDLVVTLFGLAMAFHGGDLALGVWEATLPTLGLPGTVEYLPLVLGGALIALFGLERLLAHAVTGAPPAGLPEHTLLTDA
ncbi:TRAP transporter small permease [Dankookia sp. GCM10030260]|uniref:TRAP transporter small permease n=1 Tax=Dankookia sp. GCM10030260 TaxID=3273390 RepID=UPI00360913F8